MSFTVGIRELTGVPQPSGLPPMLPALSACMGCMGLDLIPGWSQDVGGSPSKREMLLVLQIKQAYSSLPPTPVCATRWR